MLLSIAAITKLNALEVVVRYDNSTSNKLIQSSRFTLSLISRDIERQDIQGHSRIGDVFVGRLAHADAATDNSTDFRRVSREDGSTAHAWVEPSTTGERRKRYHHRIATRGKDFGHNTVCRVARLLNRNIPELGSVVVSDNIHLCVTDSKNRCSDLRNASVQSTDWKIHWLLVLEKLRRLQKGDVMTLAYLDELYRNLPAQKILYVFMI